MIHARDLPATIRQGTAGGGEKGAGIAPLKKALEEPERRIILRTLRAMGYNRLKTARALGINRTTLYNKMKRLDILDAESHRS